MRSNLNHQIDWIDGSSDGPYGTQPKQAVLGAALTSHPDAVVQDRPYLGSMPRTGGRADWWLVPAAAFIASSVALGVTALMLNTRIFPAWPLLPLLVFAVDGVLALYHAQVAPGGHERAVRLVPTLLIGALFAWSAALFLPLTAGTQLILWGTFVVLDIIGRAICIQRALDLDRKERWILVGDAATARQVMKYEPLRAYARVVRTMRPAGMPADREAALEAVDCHRADRVVIASHVADDKNLVDLVMAFKSIGVPVSLLPRPLDLLEALTPAPGRSNGLPMIDIETLSVPTPAPYTGSDRRSNRKTAVSVVIPAMNEEKNLGAVLSRLPENLHEVILVDGNSRDNTVDAARAAYPRIRVLTQRGKGKGDALRTGFAAVTGNLVVMIDADGSMDPQEIPRFVDALEGGADFAKGSRFLAGGGSDDITNTRRVGNAFLSGTVNLLYRTRFSDLCYGYNAFWARCLPFISLDVPGFEVETLINLRAASAGMRIAEVPSYEAARRFGQSNLNTFRDGFRVLRVILRETRRPRGRPSRPQSGFSPEPRQAGATVPA